MGLDSLDRGRRDSDEEEAKRKVQKMTATARTECRSEKKFFRD